MISFSFFCSFCLYTVHRPPPTIPGPCCLAPTTLVSAGFCLSLFASSLCNFMRLDDDNDIRSDLRVDKIGFYCYEPTWIDERFSMGDLEFDEQFQRARAFSITANVFGFTVWLIYLIAGCKDFPPTVFMVCANFCYIACFFEGFKFWMLRSTYFCDDTTEENMDLGRTLGCRYDTAGKCSISAIVIWFFAGKAIIAHTRDAFLKYKEEQYGGGSNDAAEAPAENA